jgi:hypothetical protein
MSLLLAAMMAVVQPATAATLKGWAQLPADSFLPGPTSGASIRAANGRTPPFTDRQPVQGVSALLNGDDGWLLALADNGFGSQFNSVDFLLQIYRMKVDFRTAGGGSGSVLFEPLLTLHDPDGLIQHAGVSGIIAHWRDKAELPWDARLADFPWLTGSDFDPESFQRAADGSFWIGDEFGPYLLHVDAEGKLLNPPFALTGVRSPDNHNLNGEAATLPRSRGFEGMAIDPSGRYLYPMLEGSLTGEEGVLNIYCFDIESGRWLNPAADSPSYRYRPEPAATAIGAFQMLSRSSGLVIERDSASGDAAVHKKIYRADLERAGADGTALKTEVADLLDIDDPHDLDRDGQKLFRFPHQTIESIVVIDRNMLLLANDNNYPFGDSRTPGEADGTEFILIEVGDLW